MARYCEETALIKFVKLYTPTIEGETTLECVERAIRNAPAADVAPKSEVAREICCEIEEEIVAALESNYKALKSYDDGRCNDYILELVGRIKGKIDALRGIEHFVEEIKDKYTEKECPKCTHFVGCECFDGQTCDEYTEEKK